jgi:hypothetical protein
MSSAERLEGNEWRAGATEWERESVLFQPDASSTRQQKAGVSGEASERMRGDAATTVGALVGMPRSSCVVFVSSTPFLVFKTKRPARK